MKSEPVAQVCLYGTRETGYAYLASRPELTAAICAAGGWNADQTRPTGRHLSLTEIIEKAKADLRALGITRGAVVVFFPGGLRCTYTPVDAFQEAERMRLEPALLAEISDDTIVGAARTIGAISATRSPGALAQLGRTASGKPVPCVPARLGSLEMAASAAVAAHGLADAKASPAIQAAHSALVAHFESYTREFTVEDHRGAGSLIAEHKWASADMDRYLRYAHNGLESLHRRAVELSEEQAWRR